MRCSNIEFIAKMPLPQDADLNNIIYTKESLKTGFTQDTPIPLINENNIIIGIVNNITFQEEDNKIYAIFKGVYTYGGTMEDVIFDDMKNVTNLQIKSVCFGCE